MKKIFYSFLAFVTLYIWGLDSVQAQTNCGNGSFTVRVTRVQYIGGDGADNCDEAGFGCGFEHRLDITSNAGSGAAGPGCQSYTDDNDFNPNLFVAQHQFNVGGSCAVLPNTITVGGNIHEDDSFIGNCTVNSGDDDNCNFSTSASTIAAFNSPCTAQTFTTGCAGLWTITFTITWTPLTTGGATCPQMMPICANGCLNFQLGPNPIGQATGSYFGDISACTSTYTAAVNNNYLGCIQGTPASAGAVWWYMKTLTAGNIVMQLSAASDVDFIVYGPYTNLNEAISLCGRHRAHVDCSWDPSGTETIRINNMQVGDIYVLYVLNYAAVVQNASLIKTSGTGAFDCNIINDCLIRSITNITTTACNPANDTYTASLRVNFEFPPALPTNLIVNGQAFALTAADVSAGFKNITLTGLPANGGPVSVTAYFSTDPACVNTRINAWTAPNPCDPCPANPGNW